MTDNEASGEPAPNDTVRFTHQCYREARQHSSDWRTQAPKWYDLVANRQWDEDDIATMEDQKRIPVVINRTARAVNAILGTQISNRQQTQFYPRQLGDAELNEILTGAADWVRDGCDAEDEETDAFEDTTTCGMGWTETHLDFETDADGSILIERVDPLEMYWDPRAKKRNLADGRWFMRVVEMPKDEFETRWPEADIDNANAPWNDSATDTNQHHATYPQDAYKEQQALGSTQKKNTVRVVHIQWAEHETIYRVGKRADRLSEEKFKKIEKKLAQAGIPSMRQQGVTWKQAFVAGSELLEEHDCPYPQGPTLRCITYKRDRNKNTWYGVVAAMMDPQKYGNKFLSLIMDIITKSSKGGVMMEKDAVDDPDEVEKKWARPDAIVFLRSGGIGKVKEKPQINLPPGLDRLVAYFLDSVHEVTGINLELLGMANREQAGVLEHQRKQAGVTIIAPLFDGLRRYRKEQGRVLLYFIQNYISDGRLIRITGDGGNEKYVPLVKDVETAKYDVIVDEAPTSPNMKERTFGVLSELIPVLLKSGIPIPPEILDYAPLPAALVAKWKTLLQNTQGDPKQMQAQIQQMQEDLQKLTEENKQLKDKKDEAFAQLQIDAQKAQQQAQLDREKMEFEMQLEREKMQQEIQLEREKAQGQLQVKAMEVSAQTDMQREQTGQQLALEHEKAQGQFHIQKQKLDQERRAKGLHDPSKRRTRNYTVSRDANGDIVGGSLIDEPEEAA